MKKARFTEQQIVFAIKQPETGTRVDEICRQMRKKYGGLGGFRIA